MKIKYTEEAIRNIKSFNVVERQLITKKLHYLADNFQNLKLSKKVTELKGTEFEGQYRFVIARKIRAIFRIENGELILLILRIGQRKNIY